MSQAWSGGEERRSQTAEGLAKREAYLLDRRRRELEEAERAQPRPDESQAGGISLQMSPSGLRARIDRRYVAAALTALLGLVGAGSWSKLATGQSKDTAAVTRGEYQKHLDDSATGFGRLAVVEGQSTQALAAIAEIREGMTGLQRRVDFANLDHLYQSLWEVERAGATGEARAREIRDRIRELRREMRGGGK